MRVLVTGATGFVGSALVPALVAAGHDVVALVRDPGRYDPPAGVAVVAADLLDRDSLAEVFDGADAAYYLVHSLRAGGDYAAQDRVAARNFADAASGRVDRVVYLGGLWRSLRYAGDLDADARAAFRRIDALTIAFALLRLLLLPFVWGRDPLVAAIVGHVVAVTAESGAAAVRLS